MAAVFRAFVVAGSVLATIFKLAMAANHDVSWDLTTNYAQWAAGKNFSISDTITFSYVSGQHDVSEVSSSAYSSCSSSNPITTSTGGSTVVTLKTAGKRYFICGIPGHCQGGMKLAINVVAASSPAPSPSPATAPSPSPLSPAAAPAPFFPAAAPPPESDSSAHTDSPPVPSGAAKKVTFGFSLGMVMMLLAL